MVAPKFADMLPEGKPQGLRFRAGIGPLSGGGGPEMVDITDVVDHFSIRIERSGDSDTCTLAFTYSQEISNFYDVRPNGAVWVDDTTDLDGTGRYHRYFAGLLIRPSATAETGYDDRDIDVECVDNNDLLHRPYHAIGVQWPPGNGTPVVSTVVRQSIVADTPTVIEPESMHDIYAGKYLEMGDPDGTNYERFSVTSVNLTGNKTVAAAVPKTAIGAVTTVTPSNMTGLSNGMRVYCFSRSGKGDETVTISNVTGTTFDATFTKPKDADWVIMAGTFTATLKKAKTYGTVTVAASLTAGDNVVVTPTGGLPAWIYVGQQLTVHNHGTLYTGATSVAAGFAHPATGESPESHTVTPASMTGIIPGIRLRVYNPDNTHEENITVETTTGTTFTAVFGKSKAPGWLIRPPTDRVLNWEVVTVEAVNTSSGTFTADFTSNKAAGWTVEAIPTLSGGLSPIDLLKNGWQQEVDGILTSIEPLMTLCYGSDGPAVSFDGIADFKTGLPHMKWEGAVPYEVFEDVKRELSGGFETTVAAAVTTTGSLVWVTPERMYGIYPSKEIVVLNAAGTNRETVEVVAVDETRFQAVFTTTKAAGWYILGEIEARAYVTVIDDTPDHSALWSPLFVMYDAANQDETTLEIADTGPTAGTYIMPVDYTLGRDGIHQVNAAQIFNEDAGVFGTYEDATDINRLGRRFEGKPVKRTDIFTQDAADAIARKHVATNLYETEVVNVTVRQQISRKMFLQAKKVRFRARAEPTTQPGGKTYPLTRISLSLPDGVPQYELELGPPLPELGTPTPYELTAGPEQPYHWKLDPVRTNSNVVPTRTGKQYTVDTAGGERRITLPPAAQNPGMVVGAVKRSSDGNRVVFQPQDRESIGGRHELALEEEGQASILQSDGETWNEVSNAGFYGLLNPWDIERDPLVWIDSEHDIVDVLSYLENFSDPRVTEDLTNNETRLIAREWFWNITPTAMGTIRLDTQGFNLTSALNWYAQTGYTGNITADTVSSIYTFNCTAAARTLTLPAWGSSVTRLYIIGKGDTSTNTLTIAAAGSDTIDGASTKVLTKQSTVVLYAGASGWITLLHGSAGAGGLEAPYALEYGIPDGGAVISGTNRSQVVVPDTGTITGWQMISSLSGSITVNVIHYTYAGYTGSPTTLFSPALSSAVKNTGTVSHAVTKGDILRFEVSGTPTTVQDLTLAVFVERGA